jgi:plasmid maintenance system antidote protein VapI
MILSQKSLDGQCSMAHFEQNAQCSAPQLSFTLARMLHDSIAATADMAVYLSAIFHTSANVTLSPAHMWGFTGPNDNLLI